MTFGMAEWGLWVKKLVSGLALVPASPLFLIVLGLVLSTATRRRRLGHVFIGLGAAVLLVLSIPAVSNGMAAPIERDFPPLGPDVPMPPHAAIVVLGGGMQQGAIDYGGETVNATTLARLRAAARLAARTHLPILVSGGRPLLGRTTEAEQMADALEHDFGTPVRWIENGSLDTADNASMSTPLLKNAGIGTAVIVTDVSQVARARALFVAAGIDVIAAPTDYYASPPFSVLSLIPSANALRRSSITIHEWVGLLWARLRGTAAGSH